MSGITAQEAFNRLDSITTKEELLSLINEISIESSGTKTALYFPRSQRPRWECI